MKGFALKKGTDMEYISGAMRWHSPVDAHVRYTTAFVDLAPPPPNCTPRLLVRRGRTKGAAMAGRMGGAPVMVMNQKVRDTPFILLE